MNINEIKNIWLTHIENISDWQQLIKDVIPKQTGCGPVYELPNPIERPNESFAIADMRDIRVAEPHYHSEVEIYFCLQGSGLVLIGKEEQEITKGSVVVIPSNTAHFTIPKGELVLAVVNIPPFQQENYIKLTDSNEDVKFDKSQFDDFVREKARRLTKKEVLSKIKDLNFPKGSYIIYGAAPLAMLGIRDVRDVEFLATEELYEKLEKDGWKKISKGYKDEPVTYDIFEAHNTWKFSPYAPTLPELLKKAFYIEDIPFASLEDVRKWKQASGRPKDLVDLKLIDGYLARRIK